MFQKFRFGLRLFGLHHSGRDFKGLEAVRQRRPGLRQGQGGRQQALPEVPPLQVVQGKSSHRRRRRMSDADGRAQLSVVVAGHGRDRVQELDEE